MSVREIFLATLVISSILTTLVTFYYKNKNVKARFARKKYANIVHEFCAGTYLMLVFFAILHIFVVEKFVVPSGSMKPTLIEGDFILLNKFHYGFNPPFINKYLYKNNPVKRGDVIVFRDPRKINDPANATDLVFIKRVVGLPGDSLRYKNKILYINDQPAVQRFIGKEYDFVGKRKISVRKLEEELGNNKHEIYLNYGLDYDVDEFVIPNGYYYCLGDNRDNSKDSRYMGLIPEDFIIGKASMIFFSIDFDKLWPRLDRVGYFNE